MNSFNALRIAHDGQSSIARWVDPNGTTLCYCVEPGFERQPHPGIPIGTYRLRLRTVGEKHAAYLKWYGDIWHKGMVEICDVPGRTAIEFHVGNTIADTEGCSCCGEKVIPPDHSASKHYEVTRSRVTYEIVYPILRDAILSGDTSITFVKMGAGAMV